MIDTKPCRYSHADRRKRLSRRRGQSLVEFALVAFVLYFVFAGILSFGQLFFGAQSLQSAADTAAREIARLPLPPATSPFATASENGISLYDVLYNPSYSSAAADSPYAQVRSQVFDPQYLLIGVSQMPSSFASISDWVKTWPVINQMLYPLMVYESASDGTGYLWYPGAIPGTDSNGWPVYCIALVTGRQANGAETIEWVPVIEETLQDNASTGDSFYAFNVQSQYRGLVALRINYPYQSATLSAYPQQTTWPPQPNGQAISANDAQVTVASNPTGFTPSAGPLSSFTNPTYGGTYGLGNQYAWLTQVRPFRRVISAEAVARREVFLSPTTQ